MSYISYINNNYINNKKIYFLLGIFIICAYFLNPFVVKADDNKYQQAAEQVKAYFEKYPTLVQPIPASSTDYYCAKNDIYNLNELRRGDNVCTDFCIKAFLKPKSSFIYAAIKTNNINYLKTTINEFVPQQNVDLGNNIIRNYSDTVCNKTPSKYANSYLTLINSIKSAKSIDEIINNHLFNIVPIINPENCNDSLLRLFINELGNSPFSDFVKNHQDVCKSEYFNSLDTKTFDSTKAKQCLTNLANDLRAASSKPPLNPYNDSDRANQIMNLATALETFRDCPNETNSSKITGFQLQSLSGETEYQLSDTPECAIGYSGGSFWDLITQPINLLVGALITLFTNILKYVLEMVVKAFWFALYDFPKMLGGYTHFAPIQTMWKIFINYADLGIVLGMIFSSIATFFGIEKYSYRKMFPRLIILALLINFSLVFIGIVIDLSNYLTFIFFPGGDGQGLAHLLITVINNIICAIRGVDQSFAYTAGATVGLIITSIMLFQFVGLIYFVIIRYLTILLCAATSPLAALGIALNIPKIEGIVNLWRNKLTEALVNIVILSIAFYFSLTITSNIANEVANTTQGIIPLIVYSIFIIALFQLVRIAGKAVGVSQVEAGFNWAKGLAKTATFAAITAAGGFALGKFMTSGAWSKTQKALLENGAKGNLIAGNLGRWMSKTQNSFTAQRYKGVSDTLANESPDVIRTRLAQYEALGDKERATIALGILADKGKLTWEDLPRLAKYKNYQNFDKNIGGKLAEKYPDIKRALNNAIFTQDPYLAYQESMPDLAKEIVINKKSDGLANWKFLFDAYKTNPKILDNLVTNIADKITYLKLDPSKDRKAILGILNNVSNALLSVKHPDTQKIASEIINTLKSKLGTSYDKVIESSNLNKLARI